MLKEILKELEEMKNESTIKRFEKNNEIKPYFGVQMKDISSLSKKYKDKSNLFTELFNSNVLEAQLLAINIAKVKTLGKEDIKNTIRKKISTQVIDKVSDKVISKSSFRDEFIEELENEENPYLRRYLWNLKMNKIINKEYNDEEITSLLNEIESSLSSAVEVEKWVVNRCYVEIALNYPNFIPRVMLNSEKIGAYKDMVVSKGCTSAYAPNWINAVLKKK